MVQIPIEKFKYTFFSKVNATGLDNTWADGLFEVLGQLPPG